MSGKLLEVEDLHVWFDLLARPRAARRPGGLVRSRPRRAARARRRVGLRQDDDDPRADGPATADRERRRPGAARRRDVLARGERTVAPHRWRDVAMVFQGAMNAFNPVRRIGDQLVEPMELHGVAEQRRGSRGAIGELLERVGISEDADAQLPARVLGRDAAARGDRDGARVQPEAPARRRAYDGPRRDGSGADPRAADRARERSRARTDSRHARPAGGGADVHCSGRHVRGRDRRDGTDGRALPRRRDTPTRGSSSRRRPTSSRGTSSSRSRARRRGSTRRSRAARSGRAATRVRRAAP